MPGFLAASLAPRIRGDFSFGDTALGVAAATFYVVSMVGSSWLARLVERVGAARGMRLCAAATIVACAAVVAFAHSAAALALILAGAGVGNALASPAVSMMLKAEVPVERQGLAFGAQQAGAPIGALLAGLAVPAVAIPFGWRWAYVAVAVLAVAAVVSAPPAEGAAGNDRPPARAGGFGVVHALGLASFLASAASIGFINFLVVYSVDNGISDGAAGLLLAAVSFCAAAARIVLGLHADRGDQDALRPVAAMFAFSVAGYVLLIAGQPVAIVVAALLAGSLGWAWPGALNLAVVQRSPDAPAWAVGVMMTGLFGGAIAGPVAVGVLAGNDLWAPAWILCAVFALLAAATVVAVRRHEARAAL
jgi:MFS family permease